MISHQWKLLTQLQVEDSVEEDMIEEEEDI